jgi:diacylglycerol O-acyltransferase
VKLRMSPVDASFIHMERPESPQHGSVLFIFRIPPGAPADYMQRLFRHMRQFPVTAERFNYLLTPGWRERLAPSWTVLPPERIDLDYHFRHSALPLPGGELELAMLVSRLLTHPLDLSRPAWEMHLIEGLQDRRFALYMKMHHALVDGMTVLRMVRNWLSQDPARSDIPPLWANKLPRPAPARVEPPSPPTTSALRRLADAAAARLPALREVQAAVHAAVDAAQGRGDGLVAPYTAPRTILNGRVTQRRRISTQRLELARVRRIATKIDGTVNDAVALLVGTALRRYLSELEALPERSLVAGVLASLRQAMAGTPGAEAGNVISFIFADLATDTDDIGARAARVCASTRAGKEHLLGLKGNAMAYTALMLAPALLATALGQGHRIPAAHNLGLSNVPGCDVPLYYNGAEAEGIHATTIVAHGQALIITLTSWNRHLNFTFTACPDTVPHSQRLAVYLAEALPQVERALELASRVRAATRKEKK